MHNYKNETKSKQINVKFQPDNSQMLNNLNSGLHVTVLSLFPKKNGGEEEIYIV